MTKEEKIKEAYGELWDIMPYKAQVDALNDFGYIKTSDFYLISNGYNFTQIETKEKELLFRFHRPKSLQGIEDNNMWIKIESEDDLPKEEKDYWVVDSYGEVFICFFDEDYKAFKGYFHYDQNGKITHYQPIEKPKPPLF